MRNKREMNNNDFHQFRTRIFVRIAVMMLGAVGGIYLLYVFVLHRNFANWVVDFLHDQFQMTYESANRVYRYSFRRFLRLL